MNIAADEVQASGASRVLLKAMFVGPRGVRAGWRFALFNLLFLVFASGLLFLRRSLTPGGFQGNAFTAPAVALQEFLFLIALLLALTVMLRLEKRPLRFDFLPMRRALGWDFCSGLAWGFGAMTLLLAGMRALHAFYFGSSALRGMQVLKFGSLWGLAFLLVGIFEESFSRGYAQATLSQGIGFWPAAVVNSLIFAGIHITNTGESVLGIASVLCVALFFCLTLWRTGSLWFAVGFHAAWDYAETFIYGVPDSARAATGHLLNPHFEGARWITGGNVGPEGSVLVFGVYGLAALLFVLLYAKRPWQSAN
jgi:CAAX protease family protein